MTGEHPERTSSESRFTAESWHGGYYELGLVLGPVSDPHADDRLGQAVRAVWSHADLSGPYPHRLFSTSDQRIDIASAPTGLASLYGVVRLSFGATALSTIIVREEAEPFEDWLYVSLPLGELSRILPAVDGYPVPPDDDGSYWTPTVDAFLLSVAETVAECASFDRGFIGWEVSGFSYENRTPVPEERAFGVLLGEGNRFTYYPATLAER